MTDYEHAKKLRPRPAVGDCVMITIPNDPDDGIEALVNYHYGANWCVDVASYSRPHTTGGIAQGTHWGNLPDSQWRYVCLMSPPGHDPRTLAVSGDMEHAVIDVADTPAGVGRSSGLQANTTGVVQRVLVRMLDFERGNPDGWQHWQYLVKVRRLDLPWENGGRQTAAASTSHQTSADMFPHRCDGCGARCYRGAWELLHESANGCPIGR